MCCYNGHPDIASPAFSIEGRRAVVIGNGNVALDVARLLALPGSTYASTSVSGAALESLTVSGVEGVAVVGRRSQASVAYSTANCRRWRTCRTWTCWQRRMKLLSRIILGRCLHVGRGWALARRSGIVAEAAARMPTQTQRIVLRYGLTPVSVVGTRKVTGIEPVRLDGTTEVIETSLVIWAVGFTGQPSAGLLFDEDRGVIPNRGSGRRHAHREPCAWRLLQRMGEARGYGCGRDESHRCIRDRRVLDRGLQERPLGSPAWRRKGVQRSGTGATARPDRG